MRQNACGKKLPGKMIVEQIIEFESRGWGPYSHTCTPKTGYFMIIQKTSKKNKSSNGLLFAANNSGKYNALYFPVPPSGPKFNSKTQDFKSVFLTINPART